MFHLIRSFSIRIAGILLSFSLLLTVTNMLSPSDSGMFSLCFAMIQVFSVIATLGTSNLIIREVGIHWGSVLNKVNDLLSSVVIFCFVLISLMAVLVCVCAYFFSDKYDYSAVLCLLLSVLFFSINEIFANAFYGTKRNVLANFFQSSSIPLCFVLLFFLFYSFGFNLDFKFALLIYCGSALLSSMSASLAWFWQSGSEFQFKVKALILYRTTIFSLLAMMLFLQLSIYLGQFVLGSFLSPEYIAYYYSSHRVAMLVSFVLVTINLIVSPKLAKAYNEKNIKGFEVLIYKSTLTVALLSIPIVVFVFVFASEILSFFGEEYIEYAVILRILTIGQLVNSLTGPVGKVLNMTSHDKEMTYIVVFLTILGAISMIIMVQNFGVIGAAISASIMLALQNIFAARLVYKYLGVNVFNSYRASMIKWK